MRVGVIFVTVCSWFLTRKVSSFQVVRGYSVSVRKDVRSTTDVSFINGETACKLMNEN